MLLQKMQSNVVLARHETQMNETRHAVDKHTKISVKISVEIRISANIQTVKYRPIISVGRCIGRSLVRSFLLQHMSPHSSFLQSFFFFWEGERGESKMKINIINL